MTSNEGLDAKTDPVCRVRWQPPALLLSFQIRPDTRVEILRVILADAESTTAVGPERVVDDLTIQLLIAKVLRFHLRDE